MGGIVIKSESQSLKKTTTTSSSNHPTTASSDERLNSLVSQHNYISQHSFNEPQDYHLSSTHLYATLYNYVDLDKPDTDSNLVFRSSVVTQQSSIEQQV